MRGMAALADNWKDRISVDPRICHGQACIRGTRIMVWLLVELVANGESFERILEGYPTIERADLFAALKYASYLSKEHVIPIKVEGLD
jgi:uncharacterized protein (DUF433 family)